MNEKYKNYPIKFYSKRDNSVEYKSPYLRGSAKNLNTALNDIMSNLDQIEYDLQNYDDVQDVKFSNFKPSEQLTGKHKKYLGQLDVIFDLNDIFKTDNTIQNIVKNPKDKIKHDKIIQLLKTNNSKEQHKNSYKGNVMNFIKKFKNYAEEFTKEPDDFETSAQYELEKQFEKEIDKHSYSAPFKNYLQKLIEFFPNSEIIPITNHKYKIKIKKSIADERIYNFDSNKFSYFKDKLTHILNNNKKIKSNDGWRSDDNDYYTIVEFY